MADGFALAPLSPVPVATAIAFGPGDGDGPDLYATALAGDVVRVSLLWTAAGPVAEGVSTYESGFSQPLGLVFDGDVLYVADSVEGAESGRLDGRVTRVEDGERTVVVSGLPNGRHNTNNLRFGPDGRLYIANGNPNDNGQLGGEVDVFPYSGAILSVDVDEVAASPATLRWKTDDGAPIAAEDIPSHPLNADFAAKVRVLAWGFRNVYDVAFSPAGDAYTATNGADEPSSQDLLYRLTPGVDYGYPFCYNEGEPGATGAGVTVVPNPVFADAARCEGVPAATALLGWHICATGLDFPTDGANAFPEAYRSSVYVAECGPFFPEPAEKGLSTHDTGHKVARVALGPDGEAIEVRDFVTGLALPTDVLFGPDGAMYIADAQMLYRVVPL